MLEDSSGSGQNPGCAFCDYCNSSYGVYRCKIELYGAVDYTGYPSRLEVLAPIQNANRTCKWWVAKRPNFWKRFWKRILG